MSQSITLGAVGDIGFCRDAAADIRRHGMAWPFAAMRPWLRRCDLLCGNMESVIRPPDYPPTQIDPAGLADDLDASPALAAAGFDLMTLANNHILDAGAVGMFHTRDCIEAQGVATVGVGRTAAEARTMRVLERGGLRIGFLAYAEDTNYTLGTRGACHAYYRLPQVLADVAANRRRVDALVVSIHADLEFMETPSVPRRDAARRIARAGATLVLQHHPHVPQGVERVGRSLIASSLGNFFFPAHSMPYMRENGPHTADSLLLLVELTRGGVASFDRIPVVIGLPPCERPSPARGAEARRLRAYFAELDAKLQDDATVRRNWREISMRHLKAYLDRLANGDYSTERAMTETLGRLLFVQENRLWLDEAQRGLAQEWRQLVGPVDPLHRPYYRIASRWPAKSKPPVKGKPLVKRAPR